MYIRRTLVIPALAACMALIAALATAQSPELDLAKRTETEVPTVLKVMDLQPQLDTEVVLPDFKATFYSDGVVRVGSQGTYPVNGPTKVIQFEVDTINGTYSTKVVDPAESGQRPGIRLKNGDLLVNDDLRGGSAAGGPPTKSPGDWWGSVKVETLDPIFIELTATKTELAWRVFWNGTVNWLWTVRSCWAANPSPLGTHWFVDSCNMGFPWFVGWTKVCNQTSGAYHNTDFLTSANTYANQWTLICGRNDALFEYNWTHNDSGEGSLLIFGWLTLN